MQLCCLCSVVSLSLSLRVSQLSIRNDEELNKLLGGVTIASGGVLEFIPRQLLPKTPYKFATKQGSSEEAKLGSQEYDADKKRAKKATKKKAVSGSQSL